MEPALYLPLKLCKIAEYDSEMTGMALVLALCQ